MDATIREDDTQRIALRAGPLAMELDPQTGFLRYIRLGEREVLRGIYAAIRDRNWGTVTPEISEWQVERGEGTFRVTFTARCRQDEIDFEWDGEIAGSAEGTVDYHFDGTALSTVLRSRIGFCVLHGSTCAGVACTLEHVDGSTCQSAFPKEISPDEPFRDLRAMRHEVASGVTARVAFEGDTFETEDQRNWTDASFKTYCTPLSLPCPIEIKEGTRVRQSVTVTLSGQVPSAAAARASEVSGPEPVVLSCGPACRMPRIGLGMASHGKRLSEQAISRLTALGLDHLHVPLKANSVGWDEQLALASELADRIGSALHVGVTVDEGSQEWLRRVAQRARAMAAPVTAWFVYDSKSISTSDSVFEIARATLADVNRHAMFAMGTDADFAELNRNRPSAGLADWISYAMNPQIHAFDNDSLVETLEAQRDTVVSARRFAGRSEVAVCPVTLKQRFNPVATGPEPEPKPGELPSQVDARQPTLFAAGWTLGSIASLAAGGATSVTYFETTGWRGVMEEEEGCPLPERFPSIPGCVFPMYHLMADLAGLSGTEMHPLISSIPLRVTGLLSKRDGGVRLWVANFARQPQAVRLPDDIRPGGSSRLRMLDATNVSKAMTSPEAFRQGGWLPLAGPEIILAPHALACIECSP